MNRPTKDPTDEALWVDAAEKARRLAVQLRSDAGTLRDAPETDTTDLTLHALLRTADAADGLAAAIRAGNSVTDAPSSHDRSASPLPEFDSQFRARSRDSTNA